MSSVSDPVTGILAKLEGIKRTEDNQWMALCPAHSDSTASLSIKRGDDGRALVKCFAGCTCQDICRAIGLTEADLFAKDAKKAKPALVAIYPYRDERGTVLYEAVRYAPKDFKQRRPDGKGCHAWKLEGVRRVLYRLPELIAADPSAPVFIAEGEKDVDRLVKAGLVATCNVGGAGKWKPEYNEPLRGRRLVVIADKDSPEKKYAGQRHARAVCTALTGIAAEVKYLELPGERVKDAYDWFEAGGTVDTLMELVERAAVFNAQQAQEQEQADGDQTEAAPWLDPLPLPAGVPPVPAFDYSILPAPFRGWVTDIAERMQCPVDYLAVTAMVSAATLIGRKVVIRPKQRDDWQVVANLWGLCVGRPSLMKSPAIQEALNFLTRLEIEAKKQYLEALAEHETGMVIAEVTKKVNAEKLKKAIKDGKNATELAEALTKDADAEPARYRYLVNNTTVEKLGVILNENPNGVQIYCDEVIGWLKSLDRDGHEGDRAFYLTAWSGDKRYTYDRIGRGTLDIEAAIISFIGAIQPGVLQDYLRQAVRGGAGDDGLVQRFQLAVWPDMPARWVNVDRWPDTSARHQAYEAFQLLADLKPELVEAERDNGDANALPFLRFDPGAQQLFDQWRGELENRLRSGADHPAIEAHLAKYRSLVPSLALIIHLAEGGIGPVSESATDRATRWTGYLECHARRLYAGVTEAPAVAARELARRICNGELNDGFTARDVYRNCWTGLDREQTQTAIEMLLALHWLDERIEDTAGRPKTRYGINPKTGNSRRSELSELTKAPSVSFGGASPEECGDSSGLGGTVDAHATPSRKVVRL